MVSSRIALRGAATYEVSEVLAFAALLLGAVVLGLVADDGLVDGVLADAALVFARLRVGDGDSDSNSDSRSSSDSITARRLIGFDREASFAAGTTSDFGPCKAWLISGTVIRVSKVKR